MMRDYYLMYYIVALLYFLEQFDLSSSKVERVTFQFYEITTSLLN